MDERKFQGRNGEILKPNKWVRKREGDNEAEAKLSSLTQ
jgi:hypothetical protein